MFRTDDSINPQSIIALIEESEQKNPEANIVYVIFDNTRYYRLKLVRVPEEIKGSAHFSTFISSQFKSHRKVLEIFPERSAESKVL